VLFCFHFVPLEIKVFNTHCPSPFRFSSAACPTDASSSSSPSAVAAWFTDTRLAIIVGTILGVVLIVILFFIWRHQRRLADIQFGTYDFSQQPAGNSRAVDFSEFPSTQMHMQSRIMMGSTSNPTSGRGYPPPPYPPQQFRAPASYFGSNSRVHPI
jgi:hypothetical protein